MDPSAESNEPNEQSQPYVAAQVVREQRPAPPRRSGWGRLVVVLLIIMLGVSVLMNMGLLALVPGDLVGSGDSNVRERYHSLARRGSDKIAIIHVDGTILDTSDGFIKKQIDRVKNDKNVKGVVLRVNSPGGTVSASDYLYHHLKLMREERDIPMTVSMGGICASGGYYLSMSVGETEDAIFAEPTTWTGSIGVVLPHYNLAGLMQEWKIEEDSIKSHPLKGIGSPTKEMTPEERAILQSLVDDSFDRFKQVVISGRPFFADDTEALDRVATGQIFSANQAKAERLVDEIGFIEDAIDRVIELAGLDKEDVRVVEYKQPPGLGDLLFGAQASRSRMLELSGLLDLTVPRAYYLCTWLPNLSDVAWP